MDELSYDKNEFIQYLTDCKANNINYINIFESDLENLLWGDINIEYVERLRNINELIDQMLDRLNNN